MTRQTGRTSGNPARDTKVWRDQLRAGDPVHVELHVEDRLTPALEDIRRDLARLEPARPVMSRAGCLPAIVLLAIIAAIFTAGFLVGQANASAPRPAAVIPSVTSRPVASSDQRPTGAPQLSWITPSGIVDRSGSPPSPGVVDGGGAPPHLIPPLCSGPCPTATPRPRATPSRLVVRGTATTYGPGYDGYLAWPDGRGWRLRICGPADCVTGVSNDAGPSKAGQRAGHVIDLDVATFEDVCGVPWRRGVCPVTVVVLGRG